MNIQQQTEQYVSTTIKKIHSTLANNFTFSTETRDLTAYENQLLQQVDEQSLQYRQLTGILAIDSYVNYIIRMLIKSEPILEVVAILFNNLSNVQEECEQYRDEAVQNHLQQTWIHLTKLAQISHELFPNSPYVNVHRQFIQGQGLDIAKTIYTHLQSRNQELASKLQQNDRQILDLQLKLTRLIEQNADSDNSLDSSAKILQLKQKLQLKEGEIERMNEEFNFEIEKYNTVYDVIKRENEQLRRGRNMDLYGLMQGLEREIGRLREQRERDQVVINELRERMIYSSSSQLRKSSSYSKLYY